MKFFKISEDKKKLFKNFISLTLLQGANYILPLMLLPYLVKTLGVKKYGLIVFAQSLNSYFYILVDFGFSLLAVKEVAVNRDDKKKLSEIFSAVLTIRIGLVIISFFILLLMISLFPVLRLDWLIYMLTFGIVVGQAILPLWFFQGLEEMKYITILNLFARVMFVFFVFLLVKDEADYILVPLFNSLGFMIAGILGLLLAVRNFKVKLFLPSRTVLLGYIKSSLQFFFSRISVSLYTSTNTVLLGFLQGKESVGYYSIAETIYKALQQLYTPLVNSLYPYVAYKKDIWFFKKVFKVAVIVNTVIILFLILKADLIILLIFNGNLEISVQILKLLLLAAFIVVPTILLGYPFLAALGFHKWANYSVLIGSLAHMLGLTFLWLFNMVSVYTVALMVIITEAIVFLLRVYAVRKYNLWRES